MMHAEARHLLNLYMANARDTESDAFADQNFNMALGLICYAAVAGDITPNEHAAHWEMVRLARIERKQSVKAKTEAFAA